MARPSSSPESLNLSVAPSSISNAAGELAIIEGPAAATGTLPHAVLPPEVAAASGTTSPPQARPAARPSTNPSPPSSRIDTLTWDDIQTDGQGEPIGFWGVFFTALTSKQLRIVCSRLEIRGVKNVRKEVMIDRIKASFKNKATYAALESAAVPVDAPVATTTPRKEIQCPFRLLNILFSDMFAERFANTGNVASRQLLDTGLAGNDQHFWESVRQAFVSPVANPVFDELQFKNDEVISLQILDIDPSKIVNHDWKKLRSIWKSTNTEYKAAITRFTQSGTHENEFWNFCVGKIEVYYLRKLLETRPNLVDFVEADLPFESQLSSSMGSSQIASRLTSTGDDMPSVLTEQSTKKKESCKSHCGCNHKAGRYRGRENRFGPIADQNNGKRRCSS